jgi:hypothetical protein
VIIREKYAIPLGAQQAQVGHEKARCLQTGRRTENDLTHDMRGLNLCSNSVSNVTSDLYPACFSPFPDWDPCYLNRSEFRKSMKEPDMKSVALEKRKVGLKND